MAPACRVYLDISIGSQPCGRLVFKLFTDVTPKAAENFRGLVTGEYGISKKSGQPLCYRGCRFFRSIPGLLLQSGDILNNDGSGSESIWGNPFPDENFTRRHAQAGCLAMANNGRHSNGSQFYITLRKAPQLDARHVVVGQLVEGMEVLRGMQLVPSDPTTNVPKVEIVITGCGELNAASALRNCSLSGVRQQLQQLMEKHEKEVRKQQEEASKLKGSDDESSSSESSDEENPQKWNRKRRQERRQARFLESAMCKAQRMLDAIAEAAKTNREMPAALYDAEESSGDEDTSQKHAAEVARPVDSLGELLEKLGGQTGGSAVETEAKEDAAEASLQSRDASAAILARRKKLMELRLKINQGRTLNTKEVLEEKKQWETPGAEKHKAQTETRSILRRLHNDPMYRVYKDQDEEADSKNATDHTASGGQRECDKRFSRKVGAANAVVSDDSSEDEASKYRRKSQILNEPAAIAEEREKKRGKKEKKTFGWNVFNEDALYRAHKKRLGEVPFRSEEYRRQQEALGVGFYDPLAALAQPDHKPSEAATARLVASVSKAQERRAKFSRRRTFDEDADVSYINERNRIYNEKLERSFKAQTLEIKQNLERGTAL